jgi:hypothetical protein
MARWRGADHHVPNLFVAPRIPFLERFGQKTLYGGSGQRCKRARCAHCIDPLVPVFWRTKREQHDIATRC